MTVRAIPIATADFVQATIAAKAELNASIRSALKKFEADTGLIPTGLNVSMVPHTVPGVGIESSIITDITVDGAFQGVSVSV